MTAIQIEKELAIKITRSLLEITITIRSHVRSP